MLIISVIIMAILVLIDQFIKFFIVDNVALGSVYSTFSIGDKDLFSIVQVRNKGAAWSIFEGKTIFLIIIAAIAIALVIYLVASKKITMKFQIVMLSLIMAGGIGNLIDRIRIKEVIDYIRFDFIDFPIFNFADMCVVVGAIGFCISYIFFDIVKSEKKEVTTTKDNNDNLLVNGDKKDG